MDTNAGKGEHTIDRRPEGVTAGRSAGTSEPAQTGSAPPLATGSGHARPPMNKADAGRDETAHTDAREGGQAPEPDEPTHWTGATEPDREFRENPPTRGGPGNMAAPDAF